MSGAQAWKLARAQLQVAFALAAGYEFPLASAALRLRPPSPDAFRSSVPWHHAATSGRRFGS